MDPVKVPLSERDIPRQWYNLAADLAKPPAPPLGPDRKPVDPAHMARIFPENLVEQEMSSERWITIPDEILDMLYRWRPAPLRRARFLEQALGTPARIWYKDESVSPAGSHKPNSAIAQVWYNKQFGIKRLTTETGAGQWGSALSFACSLMGLEAKIFMVRISFDQKPFRKIMMGVWGGRCIPSPSRETAVGRRILDEIPDTPGSLGIAISEAIEAALADEEGATRYTLGSVLNHVLLHQSIIGLEAKAQLASVGVEHPDVIIGCAGGGSNFAGIAFPFLPDRMNGAAIEIIPVEPAACPTMTRGPYCYDYGDNAGMTPLMAMHSLGHAWVPPAVHAGGLRYHGMAPLVSQAIEEGLLTPRAVDQHSAFAAAITWARSEGFIAAPETSHALAAVIQEAERAREEGKAKDILFCYSGHGLMDLSGYDKYLGGALPADPLAEDDLKVSLATLADHPRP